MSCDLEVANLCAIVARGCHGNWLELGTGTGLSTLFLAEVLEAGRLDTVDANEEYSKAAQSVIGPKQGLQFIVEDGGDFLSSCRPQAYNFVFADAWPGKYSHLHLVLNTLGGWWPLLH
jgi:predicted O-methyltransferase YrrM